MVTHGEKKIFELVIEVFDDKFLEIDTFQYCLNGCRNITRLDRDELLKKILLENDKVNQVQLITKDLHIRFWRDPIGIVTVDYRPLGMEQTKRLSFHESNKKCLGIVQDLLQEKE